LANKIAYDDDDDDVVFILACGASRRQLFSDWRPGDSEITAISPVQGNEDNHKVNGENTKITTENISISVSQLQIKQRN